MSENKRIATKKAQSRNRMVRHRARKKVEDRLTKQFGGTPAARQRARNYMRGKDVHKTGRGLELIDHKAHGKKHGRGHKGPRGKYRNK
jgi:hypothetical protein